eukprot:g24556.t1
MGQFSMANPTNLHVCGLWEEIRAPRENPCNHLKVESNPGPWYCETAVLTTEPPYRSFFLSKVTSRRRELSLARLRRDLNNDQEKLQKMNQDMKRTEDSCKLLELNFQEYCPDIKKQQAEVQKLNKRFQNASDQLNL